MSGWTSYGHRQDINKNMVNRIDFEGWVKFVAANLYDFAAIEKHPLTGVLLQHLSLAERSQYLRTLFGEGIASLKPSVKVMNPGAPEWRPFYILNQRYMEGVSLQEITSQLAISDRQLRRDHHRALQALSVILWSRLHLDQQADEDNASAAFSFDVHRERLDMVDVLSGVWQTVQRLAQQTGVVANFDLPAHGTIVVCDRVIVRQVLFSLLTSAINNTASQEINISMSVSGPEVDITITFPLAENLSDLDAVNQAALETIHMWAERTHARFSQSLTQDRQLRLALQLPRGDQPIILVVDDQETAIALFQRYLAKTNTLVVGLTRADQVLETARHLQPALIALDIMMPQVDGWEVLQAVTLHEDTRHIPVLVCSAWHEPELATSLGAAGFLKKPITQKQFLDKLQSMQII